MTDRMALVEDGVVINVALAGDIIEGYVPCPNTVGPGWLYDGQTFTPPVVDTPQQTLEDWRNWVRVDRTNFAMNVYKNTSLFSDRSEALDFVRGVIPQGVLDLIGQLPPETRDEAEFRLTGNSHFSRRHPLWNEAAQLPGWSEDMVDDLFGGYPYA